ncbi:MAG: DoxX family membrane protein [Acidobacteria bacterium]|nr:DoxX family membrane protein [Acidobacteriota bacterium]MBS1864591.1 DoxX family membrane protein [Acidobacteriota bacterium]
MFERLAGSRKNAERYSLTFLRIALGAAFLNGIASRFGLYGKNTGYGNYANYVKYAGEVNSFMPRWAIPYLANAATVAELSFGLLLVLGLWVRWAAYGSAALLAMFGIAMAISFGAVSPLDYSVFTACAGALVVAVLAERRNEPK